MTKPLFHWTQILAAVIVFLTGIGCSILVLAFTTWQVFWQDQSGWWYLLALMITGGFHSASSRTINAMLFGKVIPEDEE